MKSFSVSNPSFSNSIKIVESTDLVNADNANEAPKKLLGNTVANYNRIRDMEDSIENIISGAEIQSKIINGTYEGRDLTQVFANEIDWCKDAWEWIYNRTTRRDFDGIYIGDYIPLTINNWTYNMQVAGINCYKGNRAASNHIDFIGDTCILDDNVRIQSVQWFDGGTNNGYVDEYNGIDASCPYFGSTVQAKIDSFYRSSFPENMRNYIAPKYMFLEHRYSSSGPITDSNSSSYENLDMLWLPTEYEVFGSTIWGTKGWSAKDAVQYPLFKYNGVSSRRMYPKVDGPFNSEGWWLLTVASGNSTHACCVNGSGESDTCNVSEYRAMPLCFRIG